MDVGRILNGGCRGFAPQLMRWPQDLVVGGAVRSPQGDRLQSVRALQTLLVLRSPRDLHEEVRDQGSAHYEWSLKQAEHVLKKWQAQLRKVRAARAAIFKSRSFKSCFFSQFSDSLFHRLSTPPPQPSPHPRSDKKVHF